MKVAKIEDYIFKNEHNIERKSKNKVPWEENESNCKAKKVKIIHPAFAIGTSIRSQVKRSVNHNLQSKENEVKAVNL